MRLLNMDCREGMKQLLAEGVLVDAIVTDPPYELGFMGKKWDSSGIAYNKEVWGLALQILKPGGHLLAFGGTRTYHRMVCAIEDAGFEIRDQLQWIYGSGFPKSMNVSKQIDAMARREFVLTAIEMGFHIPGRSLQDWTKESHSPSNKWWERLKDVIPAEDWQKIEREVIAKGYRVDRRDGNVGFGLGTSRGEFDITAPATPEAQQWEGWGTALKPANEPICLARKPISEPTVAANVIKWGTGGLNIDGCRIPTEDIITNHSRSSEAAISKGKYGDSQEQGTHQTPGQVQGRFPANLLFDEAAAAMLDEQSGISPARDSRTGRRGGCNPAYQSKAKGDNEHQGTMGHWPGDNGGGASRFFYVAKASKSDRGEGNNHPTVKPVNLIEYLIKLVTPPGGTVLDPFAGSGTTFLAARNLGFNAIGIEIMPEYCAIIEKRLQEFTAMGAKTPPALDKI